MQILDIKNLWKLKTIHNALLFVQYRFKKQHHGGCKAT